MVKFTDLLDRIRELVGSVGEPDFPEEFIFEEASEQTVPEVDYKMPNSIELRAIRSLDKSILGYMIASDGGAVTESWGLVENLEPVRGLGTDVSPLSSLIEKAIEGESSSIEIDGVTYLIGPFGGVGGHKVIIVAMRPPAKAEAFEDIEVVERVSTALSLPRSVQPLSLAAVHALGSAFDLASVVLWTPDHKRNHRLSGMIGIKRQELGKILSLEKVDAERSLVKRVLKSKRSTFKSDICRDGLEFEFERSICRKEPGGALVVPLEHDGMDLGVLLLVEQKGINTIAQRQRLVWTMIEQLTVALSRATAFEQLEQMATEDPLTGIANHGRLQRYLRERVEAAVHSGEEVGVVMIDDDHFRSDNEEEGHDDGDHVLKMVAATLTASVRGQELAARYGGEEFCIVLPGSGFEETLRVAEKARRGIESLSYTTSSGRPRRITASAGCAVFPHSAGDTTTLLRSADTALFEAKRAGRNRTKVFDGQVPEHEDVLRHRLEEAKEAVSGEMRADAEKMLSQARPYIIYLAKEFTLSRTQQSILEAASLLAKTAKDCLENDSLTKLDEITSRQTLRAVAPSLFALSERFDGGGAREVPGNQIPLLGRILAVLYAELSGDRGKLSDDPGKFDPEIVAAINRFRSVA